MYSKEVRKRLRLLKLAERVGALEACYQCKTSQPTYYKWKKRYQLHGIKGLKNKSRAPHRRPQAKPKEVVDKIKALAREHPGWSYLDISDAFKSTGVTVSLRTVWKILTNHGLKSKQAGLEN